MRTIILVEDDAAIQDVFVLGLTKLKCDIIYYEGGEPILREEVVVPDLFVLDKNISGTNGLDVCRFIKSSERYGSVPVIIISASPGLEEMAREAGADDWVAKPFSLKMLRETISKYLPAAD